MAEYRYLAVGDIFTDGPELPEGSLAYPAAAVAKLRAAGMPAADPTLIIGRQDPAGRLLYRLKDAHLAPEFDFVTIQAGTWDIHIRTPHALFFMAIQDLIAEGARLAGGRAERVAVVTPALFGPIDEESFREHFAASIHQMFDAACESDGAHFLDFVEPSIDMMYGETKEITESGFPNEVLHDAWAGQVFELWMHILGPAAKQGRVFQFPGQRGAEPPLSGQGEASHGP